MQARLQDVGDVEFDLGNGVVRLMKPLDCRDRVLAYWADIGKATALWPQVGDEFKRRGIEP